MGYIQLPSGLLPPSFTVEKELFFTFLQTFLVVTINLTVLLRRWSFIGACSSGLWWHSPPRQTHFILTQSGMRARVHRAGRPHHDLGLNLHLCEFIRLTCDSNELQVWIHQVMKTLQSFVEFSRFKASWILKILWNVEAGNHQFVCTFYRSIKRRYFVYSNMYFILFYNWMFLCSNFICLPCLKHFEWLCMNIRADCRYVELVPDYVLLCRSCPSGLWGTKRQRHKSRRHKINLHYNKTLWLMNLTCLSFLFQTRFFCCCYWKCEITEYESRLYANTDLTHKNSLWMRHSWMLTFLWELFGLSWFLWKHL